VGLGTCSEFSFFNLTTNHYLPISDSPLSSRPPATAATTWLWLCSADPLFVFLVGSLCFTLVEGFFIRAI